MKALISSQYATRATASLRRGIVLVGLSALAHAIILNWAAGSRVFAWPAAVSDLVIVADIVQPPAVTAPPAALPMPRPAPKKRPHRHIPAPSPAAPLPAPPQGKGIS